MPGGRRPGRASGVTPVTPGSLEAPTSRRGPRKVTEFQEFKLGKQRQAKVVVQKEKHHPSSAIVAKVKTFHPSKLKNIMLKKMLLKFITSIYQERMTTTKDLESQRSIDIAQFIYDSNMKRYGLKRVCE